MGLPPTNYEQTIMLSNKRLALSNDQRSIRYLLTLAPAHLITDISTNCSTIKPLSYPNTGTRPSHSSSEAGSAREREREARANAGLRSWSTGFRLLTDHILLLHSANLLHLDTLNEASRACSECWTITSSWPDRATAAQSRDVVRSIAEKLRSILDPNQLTYQGGLVYVP